MGGKRKRSNLGNANANTNNVDIKSKRVCSRPGRATDAKEHGQQSFEHPVLSLYFAKLFTLREYLAETLCTAKSGRRPLKKLKAIDVSTDKELCVLLDSAVVGLLRDNDDRPNIEQEIADATQRSSSHGSGHSVPGTSSQSDVVDAVLAILFKRSMTAPKGSRDAVFPGKPNHILGLGYMVQTKNRDGLAGCNVGPFGLRLINNYPNSHVNTVKSQLWERLLRVIGEDAMYKLLLETSIFMRVGEEEEKRMYYQLSGPPISDALNSPIEVAVPESFGRATSTALGKFQGHGPSVKRTAPEIDDAAAKIETNTLAAPPRNKASADHPTLPDKRGANITKKPYDEKKSVKKTYGEIVFVRMRIFYAKPKHNAGGKISFGLKRIHVLNRAEDARHILMYMFPRQYGLHNVFTSVVNRQETVQPLQDYTYREPEIKELKAKRHGKEIPVPSRLKGPVLALVMVMQKLHRKCSYHELVKHYCPVSLCDPGVPEKRVRLQSSPPVPKNSDLKTQAKAPSSISVPNSAPEPQISERFTDYASTAGEVSGFVKAVIKRVIPYDFFGSGSNQRLVLQMVDRFIKLRRYESFSLHDVLQGLKLTDFTWLRPSSLRPEAKLSKSDEAKRRELLAEFLYWLFDSFIIPLLRAHFYITESGVDRNRVFYFRHDVWKRLSEPALESLKLNLFQELPREEGAGRQTLGFSTVRLLPKESGVRPIMNLGKRGMVVKNGKTRLTPSINTLMTPVFNTLVFEKSRNPSRLGASMFSITDMYPRLVTFKSSLGASPPRLYFAKVDVQSCFDTIPPHSLLSLIRRILREDDYRINKFASVHPPLPGSTRPIKNFHATALPGDDLPTFTELLSQLPRLKHSSILVDDVISRSYDTSSLLSLLEKHLLNNTTKIGSKFYLQKTGIPQGSILSSLLCNYFYGALEQENLPFLLSDDDDHKDSLLLRLVDDFLLITRSREKAVRFLEVMHAGIPAYGATVNPEKSLTNFTVAINQRPVPRLPRGQPLFPYCGTTIHTRTLDVSKLAPAKKTNIADTLTVSLRRPGFNLRRKLVAALRLHMKELFVSTRLNARGKVLANVAYAFAEVARKLLAYCRCLRKARRALRERVVRAALEEVLAVAVRVVGKSVGREVVRGVAAGACGEVLERSVGFKGILRWLREVEAGGEIGRKKRKGGSKSKGGG